MISAYSPRIWLVSFATVEEMFSSDEVEKTATIDFVMLIKATGATVDGLVCSPVDMLHNIELGGRDWDFDYMW